MGFRLDRVFIKVFRLTDSEKDQVEPEYGTSNNSYDDIDTVDVI